jgi:3-isopropylmalate dehydrogenase
VLPIHWHPILSAALLLDISFGMKEESELVIKAVDQVLKAGYRTRDIADSTTPAEKILGTEAMGTEVLRFL